MGYSPARVGTVFLIVPAILVFGSPFGGWLFDRYHYRYSSALGMIIVAASLVIMGGAIRQNDINSIYAAFIILGIGSILYQSPINTEIMTALPREMLGTASSLSSAVRNMGMALGVPSPRFCSPGSLTWPVIMEQSWMQSRNCSVQL